MLNIKWNEVKSSNIAALAYGTDELFVKFNTGAVYKYENVFEATFDELMGAASVGRAFNQLVKSNPVAHPFTLVQ